MRGRGLLDLSSSTRLCLQLARSILEHQDWDAAALELLIEPIGLDRRPWQLKTELTLERFVDVTLVAAACAVACNVACLVVYLDTKRTQLCPARGGDGGGSRSGEPQRGMEEEITKERQ